MRMHYEINQDFSVLSDIIEEEEVPVKHEVPTKDKPNESKDKWLYGLRECVSDGEVLNLSLRRVLNNEKVETGKVKI